MHSIMRPNRRFLPSPGHGARHGGHGVPRGGLPEARRLRRPRRRRRSASSSRGGCTCRSSSTPNATTRSLEEVTIRARVRGFLTERHFEEGSFVKKGELLLVIDEEPYKIALESAKARLDEAEATLTKAEKSKGREVAAAQLALDQAQLSLARIEERRNRALLARNAGSREDLDKAEADRKKFEAQVEADRASLEQAEADYDVGILSAKAQVEAARAAVRDAELNLGYCRMYAADRRPDRRGQGQGRQPRRPRRRRSGRQLLRAGHHPAARPDGRRHPCQLALPGEGDAARSARASPSD